jgi:hypothetical protein
MNNQQYVIVHGAGGQGNHNGGLFKGLVFYLKNNLEFTHKLIFVSKPVTNGDFIFKDLFTANNKLICLNFLDDFNDFNDKWLKIDESTSIEWLWLGVHVPPKPFKIKYTDMQDKTLTLENETQIPQFYGKDIPVDPKYFKKIKYINLASNCLPSLSDDNITILKQGFKMFDIKIKQDIHQKIISFLLHNKISQRGCLGIHVRATDRCENQSIVDKTCDTVLNMIINNSIDSSEYTSIFLCSDSPYVEKRIRQLFTEHNISIKIITRDKTTKITKIPTLEQYNWILTPEELVFINNQFETDGKSRLQTLYNVFRTKEQIIDGFIDNCILGFTKYIYMQLILALSQILQYY